MKIKNFIASVLATTILGLGAGYAQNNENLKLDDITMLNVNIDDESGVKDAHIKFREGAHKYNIRLKNEKIVEMSIDDKEIPSSEFAKYDGLVSQILKKIEEDRKQAALHREEAKLHRQQAEKDRVQAELHRKQAEEDRKQASEHRKQAEAERENAEKLRGHAKSEREHAEILRQDAEKHRSQAEIHRKQAEEDRKQFEKLVDELVEEKIISSKDDLKSLLLDENDLYVNGVKQPSDLHKKLKGKYLKDNKDRIKVQNQIN